MSLSQPPGLKPKSLPFAFSLSALLAILSKQHYPTPPLLYLADSTQSAVLSHPQDDVEVHADRCACRRTWRRVLSCVIEVSISFVLITILLALVTLTIDRSFLASCSRPCPFVLTEPISDCVRHTRTRTLLTSLLLPYLFTIPSTWSRNASYTGRHVYKSLTRKSSLLLTSSLKRPSAPPFKSKSAPSPRLYASKPS